MAKFKIAVLVGSARRESINRKLAEALAKLGSSAFDFTFVRLDELPMYNQDLEAALPESVTRFKAELAAADGYMFVTPEHSRSIPALLKNAIDWGARPWGQSNWPDKSAAITGASIGAIGSAIAQQHLRAVLGNQGLILAGGEAYITFKPDLIGTDGTITDSSTRAFLQDFIDRFAKLVTRFSPAHT
ncbi:MAG TPA: NADPH-dependent FMN reductase [Pseudolabrys sp.]|nr:NADPH-dependent FMN reductase [Pseudolabrys sp.]